MDLESPKSLIRGRHAQQRMTFPGFKPRRLVPSIAFRQAIPTKRICFWVRIQKFGAKPFGSTD
jgi:hypothetical protein